MAQQYVETKAALESSVTLAHRCCLLLPLQIAWTAFMSHMASSSDEKEADSGRQPAQRSKQLQQASR